MRLVLLLVLVELALLLGGGILVLLILRDKIVHVGLSLSELHLIHTLTSVPVKECLAAEHAGELLRDTLEHLLDSGGVTDKGTRHLETLGGNVTDGGLDVVGDPLNKVARVLVLNVEHLLVNLLGGHAATEEGGGSEVATVAGIGGAHHVLGIEGLLGELGHGEGTVLLGATGGEGGEANHEEVKTGEGDQVHSKLAKIGVKLTREAKAAGAAGHGGAHKVVKVAVGGGGELEGAEADVVEGLVIENHDLIGVLDELVDREGGVVGLDDGVGNLGGGDNGEGEHDAVGVLLADLADEERTHTGSGTTTKRVGDLEALEAVTGLGLLADNVQNRVNKLGTLGVVALGPVVAGTALAEDEVVRAEDLTEGTSADGVHGARLEIHQNSTRYVTAARGLVKVHVDALELEVRVAVVGAGGVYAVLIGDDLPELGTDLVAALATLNVNDLTHLLLVSRS
mmetsp:Transcript_8066/g.14380  ORF Transcript_8066/g.14380 Transcript_8066/m.14380 type:complete len:454 (+) Transcript_8066:282-1643(+)